MGKIFAPAAALMNRLSYPFRFALITFLFVLALGLVFSVFVTEVQRQMAFSQKETYGTAYLRPLGALYENVMNERMMSLPALTIPLMNEKELESNQAQIDRNLDALMSADSQYGVTLQTTERAGALKAKWDEIRNAEQDALRDVNLGLLASDIRGLMLHVGDTSNLILDPDLDTYYIMDSVLLKLPEQQELMTKVAAAGYRVLSKRDMSVDERAQLIGLVERITANAKAAESGLQIAFANNGAGNLLPALQAPLNEMTQTVTFFTDMLNRELLRAPNLTLSQDHLITATQDAVQGSLKLWKAELDPLDTLVHARISGYAGRRDLTVGVAAGVLLLVVYLWVGFYMAVMRTARSLERASVALESGEMSEALTFDSKDEVSRMTAASFNKIAAAAGRLNSTIDERTSELTEVAAVLAHHPDGIVITDQEGVVKVLNGSATRLLATNFDAAVGRSLADLTGDANVDALVQAALLMPGQQHTVDTMVGSRILAISATFVPVAEEKHSGLITLHDVSELRKLQHAQQNSMMAIAR